MTPERRVFRSECQTMQGTPSTLPPNPTGPRRKRLPTRSSQFARNWVSIQTTTRLDRGFIRHGLTNPQWPVVKVPEPNTAPLSSPSSNRQQSPGGSQSDAMEFYHSSCTGRDSSKLLGTSSGTNNSAGSSAVADKFTTCLSMNTGGHTPCKAWRSV